MKTPETDHDQLDRITGSRGNIPVLDVQNLGVVYPVRRRETLEAVHDLSFTIQPGETLGLVGESGSGKTSVARAILQLPPPTSGKIYFLGEDLSAVTKKRLRQIRPKLQIVFQDSTAALNPRRQIGKSIEIVLENLKNRKARSNEGQVKRMLELVGLAPDLYDRKPYELSGGQCQRVQIARALISTPTLLILDEPVSSLDVSVQAQILNLLVKLSTQYGLTQLFISHDLAVVKHLCERVAVMYRGKLCELASANALYSTPIHPYTIALLDAIPQPVIPQSPGQTSVIPDDDESGVRRPQGCRFSGRCPEAMDICLSVEPRLHQATPGHMVACHLANQMKK